MASSRPGSRWPYFPGQGSVLAAAVAILLGCAFPWALVLGRFLWGSAGALTWTLSGGLLVLAGAMVHRPLLAVVSTAGGGGIAAFFALWQTQRIVSRCLSFECVPGPGLGFLLGGGALAVYQAARMALGLRASATAAGRSGRSRDSRARPR